MWIPDPDNFPLDPFKHNTGTNSEVVEGRELLWEQGDKGQVLRCWFTDQEDTKFRELVASLMQGEERDQSIGIYGELQQEMCHYFEEAVQHEVESQEVV